ncbi:hypothetical protein LCGC14_1246170 [marine sediment metagenome]|uniref:Uncharacterized protein n=1 Tax=marine sediment metagenome TaxID=412755 RepID=A0A0F9P8C3_9ZZZZ
MTTSQLTLSEVRRVARHMKEHAVPVEDLACSWCGRVKKGYYGMHSGTPICSVPWGTALDRMLAAVEHLPLGENHDHK